VFPQRLLKLRGDGLVNSGRMSGYLHHEQILNLN